jgi:caa(3)-type oxidase subunit IV
MMGEKPEISPAGVYLVSLVLLVVTVGAAFLPLGVGNVIISLVVATLQMAFIAVYATPLWQPRYLDRCRCFAALARHLVRAGDGRSRDA